jgi:hypothetical protein
MDRNVRGSWHDGVGGGRFVSIFFFSRPLFPVCVGVALSCEADGWTYRQATITSKQLI